jgi:hypothetical protein
VKHGFRPAPKLVGFVHNPESDPGVLMDLTSTLIEIFSAASVEAARARSSGERWLVLASEDGSSHIETYRRVCSLLSLPTGFARILMVFAGGQVESLAG